MIHVCDKYVGGGHDMLSDFDAVIAGKIIVGPDESTFSYLDVGGIFYHSAFRKRGNHGIVIYRNSRSYPQKFGVSDDATVAYFYTRIILSQLIISIDTWHVLPIVIMVLYLFPTEELCRS